MTTVIPFLILLAVLFVSLIVTLRSVLKNQVTTATTHLQDLSEEVFKKEARLKERLEEIDRQAQEQHNLAKQEIERMKLQTAQETETARQAILTEARQEAERVVRQAMESRDALRHELEQALELRAIERACELIHQALSTHLRQQIHTQWLDELMHNGFAGLDRLRIDADVQEVIVRSAFPLTDEQRKNVNQRLKDHVKRVLTLKEETDPTLVAGLTLALGSVVVDGSMASKLQTAAQHAKKPDARRQS